MHRNPFGGRAPPGPAGGAHSAPPDPLAVFGEGRSPRKRKGNGEGKGKEKGRGRGKGGCREMGKRGEEGKGGKGVCHSNFYRCPPPHFLILGVAPVGSSPDRYARGSANRLKAVIASTTQLGSPRKHTPCCLIRGMFCTNYYLLKRILDIASGHVPITLLCLSLIII